MRAARAAADAALVGSAFPAVALLALAFGVAVGYQIATGIGTWGLNRTVGWGFDITNFVFWVGIGHAGTLISAVLLLFRQKWRTSINRSAEAMTIFAVICAGLFPLIHMGRPWLAYWVFPYPNFRGPLWVNWRSALLWDVFAIGTYFTISLVFWYVGLIPDLATLRDRARGLRKKIFGFLSLGWNGSARTWSRYEMACMLLAALATPLVVSVHSVVSTDFATSLVPGWHTTVLPPYFVIGAVFSGFAMVLTLMLIARKVMGFEDYITSAHPAGDVQGARLHRLDRRPGLRDGALHRLVLGQRVRALRVLEPHARSDGWAYWIMVLCNVVAPQLLWSGACATRSPGRDLRDLDPRERRHVVRALRDHRDVAAARLPAVVLVGLHADAGRVRRADRGFGLFFTLFLLFCRFLPMISMSEVDAYSPYPIHGIDELLGIRRSRLTIVCFLGGLLGCAIGLAAQYWTSAVNWPLDVGGRPFDSLPAFVPVGFEMTVLCGGLATAFLLLVRSRLWPGKKRTPALERITDDRFALVVAEPGARLAEGEIDTIFRRHGAVESWEEVRP